MTLLLGFAIGLFAAIVVVGYRHGRNIYLRQYEQEIPGWVNQGNRAVIGTYDDILHTIEEAIHFQEWEQELEMGER